MILAAFIILVLLSVFLAVYVTKTKEEKQPAIAFTALSIIATVFIFSFVLSGGTV